MSDSKCPRWPMSEKHPCYLNEFKEKEMVYFCLQYPDWKRRLNYILLQEGKDPTYKEAAIRNMCEQNIKIVEDACKSVYREQWEVLLKGVTDQKSNWYNIKLVHDIKCGKDKYYEYKHMVYYYVSLKDRIRE